MIKTLRGKWFSIPHYGSCEAINAALPAKERLAAEKPQLRPRIWYFVKVCAVLNRIVCNVECNIRQDLHCIFHQL